MHPGEGLILLVAAAALFVRCFRDRARPLWCDEVYTAFAMADPSFSHMLEALRDEINAMPPLSLVLGWGIARVIGVSELALRLPSALFAWMGIVFLWLTLRRSLNRWVAIWCAVCLPLASEMFLLSATEARCYALYFATYVAAVGLLLRSAEEEEMPRHAAWLVTLAHGCLVAVHYVGGLLSGLLVAVALAGGLAWPESRLRRHALHGAVGWLSVIPSLPFYLAQRRLGGEFNWVPFPTLPRLQAEVDAILGPFTLFFVALLVAALVADARGISPAPSRRQSPTLLRTMALFVVASLAFFFAMWFESRVGVNLFLERYLFPLSVAWMLAIAFVADALVAHLWERGAGQGSTRRGGFASLHDGLSGRRLVVAAAAALSMVVVIKTLRPRSPEAVEREALQVMRDHPGIPVVTSGDHLLAEVGWYRRASGGVVMLNDSHYAGQPIGLRIGAALERHYLPQSMKSLPECAETMERFVFANPTPTRTDVEEFLRDQGGWRATKLGPHTTLWDRRPDGAAE